MKGKKGGRAPIVYEKDEKDSSGYKHSRAWFLSWEKALGYDSFPWSVKRG